VVAAGPQPALVTAFRNMAVAVRQRPSCGPASFFTSQIPPPITNAFEFPLANPDFDVLIGRDVLSLGTLHFNAPMNQFTFCM